MTLGHAVLAIEPIWAFYMGCILLIAGNGLFKPNISSIVGQLYPEGKESEGIKDAGYTIFYMGINVGAFLGILLCGYLGEKIGWHYGFGLAGIFMLFGTIQFLFARKYFKQIGEKPQKTEIQQADKRALTRIEKDRLIVVGILSFFTIFFWFAFEQAGSSMNIFARDYTQRTFNTERAGTIFNIVNTVIALIPVLILTWLWYNLLRKIGREYPLTVSAVTISLIALWALVIWMLNREYNASVTEVTASWFQTLNSLFIVLFAPIISAIWKKLSATKYNPTAAVKFALALFLLGVGFLMLVIGSSQIPQGAMTAQVSMSWLCFAYLFHTLGELCLSPVGLSYVSKLAPQKLVGMMFGIWFVATFVANFLAGQTASFMDSISSETSLADFFKIFVAVPFAAGIVILLLNKFLHKKMHGIQ
jgi:POT family proton-dependent oligopeptide transporter